MIRTIQAPIGAILTYDRLIHDPSVMEMRRYRQHGRTDTYEHCRRVALAAIWLAGKFRCRRTTVEQAAVAGMLHDFYLYDYHGARRAHGGWHAWSHPARALANAERIFRLQPQVRDAIRCHMFPGTIAHMPRHACGWLVTAADKLCAIAELLRIDAFAAASLVPA